MKNQSGKLDSEEKIPANLMDNGCALSAVVHEVNRKAVPGKAWRMEAGLAG